ncbi:uncharacterized protein A4U43_UnF440 [Asparagus officinalis]|uniref:non-specific serine/threonine protein kinase n=2 Tax=Asparagus officinalis TaxID=4686 RepID=A0A1R3L7S3_ASPOF|nr:uncharacterized protein A4U43_UnF440 [Asparagus officinalis]
MAAPLARLKLLLALLIFFLSIFISNSQQLHYSEVSALRRIAKAIGKTNWDFNVDPCTGGSWTVPDPVKGPGSAVVCDCSFANGSECHIISLSIKGENLSGVLPWQFIRLKHLQQLDLSRNVINGTVPSEWSNLTLIGLHLMGNRLSGPFPEALTSITTLKNLSIEGNRFSGPIPAGIGKLVNLEALSLSANEFSGKLPSALSKLTNLIDLRISSNNFSGKIPDFVMSLNQLKKLHIQGSSMEGPIPSAISQLANLTDLRISDLRGKGSVMSDLSGMKSLRTMMLRNCSIHGNIPSYIGNMKTLKYLDLSFNNLTGEIPSTFSNLGKADFIYLTGNMLTGTIPNWILKRNKNVDISYNNFEMDNSSPTECLQGSVNMAESYSPAVDISTVPSCLKRTFPCNDHKQYRYSLHINCGGKSTVVNGTRYEQDTEERGASMLFLGSGWGFSSTGNFMDNDIDSDNYIASNASISMPNSQLYKNARLSAISLTYYGLCMLNGNYTVKLHFAEIIFTDDNTFSSLGQRLFNVYIQVINL